MTIDVGAGDGRAVLAAAGREPFSLVLGLDASAAAMAESSRRAAKPASKGGLPNARFVLAAVERIPAELTGAASLATVRFPWGSLLRGCLGADPAVAAGIAGLVAPGGALEFVLAPAERDRLDGLPTRPPAVVETVRATFDPLGFELVEGREATEGDIRSLDSTWGRRLLRGGGRDRGVTIVRLAR